MPATAPRLDALVHREGIEKYVAEVCLRCHVNRVDVEDVVQEVLTEILAGKDSFQPEKGEFDKWMHAIAWNVVRQHARKSKRYRQRFAAYCGSVEEHPAFDSSPERCAQRKQVRDSITHAAQDLSDREVDVIVLHVVDELTHVEIGREVGISPANSQKCFQRTRDHLKRCLQNKLLVAMPPNLAACEESMSTPKRRSRWSERSHYIVQVSTLLMAVFFVFPAMQWMQSPPALDRELVRGVPQNAAMCDNDKRVAVQDEPSVLLDAPIVKPEPASLTSVRKVSTPAKVVDKPAALPSRASSSYTFKYEPKFSAHRPSNIR